MIQTSVRPTSNEILIKVPELFIGKEVKVILFVEQEEELKPKTTMADFKGILSKAEGDELQEYVQKSRQEWERDI